MRTNLNLWYLPAGLKNGDMRATLLLVLLLAPLLLQAGQTAAQVKERATSGDAGAAIELALAYYYGPQSDSGIAGIPRDAKSAFVWGEIYMALEPDYTRGIAKITSFAEAELNPDQLQIGRTEIQRLLTNITANKRERLVSLLRISQDHRLCLWVERMIQDTSHKRSNTRFL